MTHVSERQFQRTVEEYLTTHFAEEHVEREYYLEDYGTFIDFLVHAPLGTWAIEVENHADRYHIRQGVGQAIEYAACGEDGWVPCVIVPESDHHDDAATLDLVNERVCIIQLSI